MSADSGLYEFLLYKRCCLSLFVNLKRQITMLKPLARARFEPQRGRPHFSPNRNGVRVCSRAHTKARELQWAEGTVSSPSHALNFWIRFCHTYNDIA